MRVRNKKTATKNEVRAIEKYLCFIVSSKTSLRKATMERSHSEKVYFKPLKAIGNLSCHIFEI